MPIQSRRQPWEDQVIVPPEPPAPVAETPASEEQVPKSVAPEQPGPIDRSSREAFIRSMLPYAKQAETQTGIPAETMIAINLNEQGWRQEAPGSNYFGIKADRSWRGPTTGPVATWEDYGGGRVNATGTFRAYDSPAGSYADFGKFLNENPRYATALQVLRDTGDPAAFVREVHRAGYATDPAWSDKINTLAQQVAAMLQSTGGAAIGAGLTGLGRATTGAEAIARVVQPVAAAATQSMMPALRVTGGWQDQQPIVPPEPPTPASFDPYAQPGMERFRGQQVAPAPVVTGAERFAGQQLSPSLARVVEPNAPGYHSPSDVAPYHPKPTIPDHIMSLAKAAAGLAAGLPALGVEAAQAAFDPRTYADFLMGQLDTSKAVPPDPTNPWELLNGLIPGLSGPAIAVTKANPVVKALLGVLGQDVRNVGAEIAAGAERGVVGAGEAVGRAAAEVRPGLEVRGPAGEPLHPGLNPTAGASEQVRWDSLPSDKFRQVATDKAGLPRDTASKSWADLTPEEQQSIQDAYPDLNLGKGAGALLRPEPPPVEPGAAAREPWQGTQDALVNRTWPPGKDVPDAPAGATAMLNGMQAEKRGKAWYYEGYQGWTPLTDPVEMKRLDHQVAVKQALTEGKPVPPEVLADYPELITSPKSLQGNAAGASVNTDLAAARAEPPPVSPGAAAGEPHIPTVERVQRTITPGRGQSTYQDTVILVDGQYQVHSTAATKGNPLDPYAVKKVYVVSDDATGETLKGGFSTQKAAVEHAKGLSETPKAAAQDVSTPPAQDVGSAPASEPPTGTGVPLPAGAPPAAANAGGPPPGEALVPPTPPGGAPPSGAGGGMPPSGNHIPPSPDAPGEFHPSASSANVIGLRPIQTGLSLRQRLENIFKETLHIGVPAEEHATPAMAERTRIQPVIDAQSHVVAAQGDHRVQQTFVADPKGRIPDLKNPTFPDGPTIQDVAARLPEFANRLTPGQAETMQWLRERIAPYRQLWEELGARDIGIRPDVQEGGFYLPRGRADVEGADLPQKVSGGPTRRGKGSFEKPAVFDSQAEGIGKGFEYANLHDALYSYIKEIGSRAADQHIANYLKAATDAEGIRLASTAADRVDSGLRDAVQSLRAKIAGRTTTLIRQNARAGATERAGQSLQSIVGREGQHTEAYAQGVTTRGAQATETAQGRVAGAETKASNITEAAQSGTLYAGKNDTTEGIIAAAHAELDTLRREAARTARYAQGESARAQAMSAGQQGRLSNDVRRAQQRAAAAQSRAEATQQALDGFTQDMRDLNVRWQKAQERARQTPRGMGNIDLVELQGTSFPDVLANAANKVLADERPTSGKLSGAVKVVEANNNLQRGLGATLDNSGLGIQGLLGAASDPVAYAKALGVNIKAWGRGGDQVLGAFLKDFDAASTAKGLPNSVDWTREELHIGGASTEFQVGSGMGRLTNAISNAPGIRQANRAFGYFGDALRTNWAQDELIAQMQRTGKTWQELRDSGEMASIAAGVNKGTGWSAQRAAGDLGEFILFAPRFLQSRLETAVSGTIGMVRGPLGAVGIGPGNTLEQQIARNSLLKLMGYGTLLTVAANTARGYDTDFNPVAKDPRTGELRYNNNFMRIRNVGGRDWSLFGPWDSLLALFVNTATGHPVDALRGMASGTVGEAWDLLSGRDFQGRPVPNTPSDIAKNPGAFAKWIASIYMPFSWQNVPQTIGIAQKGDYGGAAVDVVGDTLGMKGSPLSYTDMEIVVAHQLGMTKDDGSPIVSADDLSKGQRDQIKNSPELLQKAATFPTPDTGTVAQRSAGSFERMKAVDAEAEATLRKALDEGRFGKPLRDAIDAMKTRRFNYSHALLTPEILAAAKRQNIAPRDAFAEAYLNVPLNEIGTQGRLDFATFDKERTAIVAQAVADGVPENYITGVGEGTYRGQRFTDPVVRDAVEQLERTRVRLRPYYAIDDRLRQDHRFRMALDAEEAATSQAQLDRVKERYKETLSAHTRDLTNEHHKWRNTHRDVDKMGVTYGYWPTTIDKVKSAASSANSSSLPVLLGR